MGVYYRDDQVCRISSMLNLSKTDVNLILANYVCYLQEKVAAGETVKVLNICYLKNTNEGLDAKRETLGYIATELANKTNMGSVTVLRVLTTLEDIIVQDIKNGEVHCLRGLLRIEGVKKDDKLSLRITKSVKYYGYCVRVIKLHSFVRKVGACSAR